MSAAVDFDPLALRWADGVRRLQAEATDMLGMTDTFDWSVNFYKAAWLYGGLDDQADFDRLERDLWTRSDYDEIWNMLRPFDRNHVLVDSYGSLIRERSSGSVYYIGVGTRYLVTSLAHFGIASATVHVLPDGALSPLTAGSAITTSTRLYRTIGSTSVYYMSATTGLRHGVTSPGVATAWDLPLSTVEEVPPGFLALIGQGVDITMTSGRGILPFPTLAEASLARDYSSLEVYYIAGGTRYLVPSLTAFGLSSGTVRVVPDGTLGSLPRGSDVATGATLYRSSDEAAVYYVSGGTRRLVTAGRRCGRVGPDLAATAVVPPAFLTLLPRGADITMSSSGILPFPTIADGSLVREAGSSTVYLVDRPGRDSFASAAVADAFDYDLADARVVPNGALASARPAERADARRPRTGDHRSEQRVGIGQLILHHRGRRLRLLLS